jgi:succinate dehydrogenase flavin-adding protein (antitoxin of CptAB toxin-antitoxin module)
VSIFVFRPPGEALVWDAEAPQEALERLVRGEPTGEPTYRVTNKFTIRMLIEMWKAVVWQGREASREDDQFVKQFMENNISKQFSPGEREEFEKFYEGLNPAELHLRNICFMLKGRARIQLKRQVASHLFKFAYSRGFTSQNTRELNFCCQLMGLPAEDIRQADFYARHSGDAGNPRKGGNSSGIG